MAESTQRVVARACAIDLLPLWNAPDCVTHWLWRGTEALRIEASEWAGTARLHLDAPHDPKQWRASNVAYRAADIRPKDQPFINVMEIVEAVLDDQQLELLLTLPQLSADLDLSDHQASWRKGISMVEIIAERYS